MTDLKGAEQTASSLAEEALNQARARFSSSESPVTPEPKSLKKKPGRKATAPQTSNTLQDLQKTLWATVRWFVKQYLRCSAPATVYYYELTAGLIRCRRHKA
ncbi:hypothetical protein [Pseudomonas orientalis]|uniref:Uncharacterized protein n=1 Tax=Pseudomonas orientalis TaxID=76758 RepID=A0A8B3Y0X3_9PSED|nr:hypothetical protein [Pseudomonas orientalis]SDU09996.1 hypothetical protein SAMN04490197_2822 [Pseudomonas orientalis]